VSKNPEGGDRRIHYSVHWKDQAEWGAFCCQTLIPARKREPEKHYTHTFDRRSVTCRVCLKLTELILPRRPGHDLDPKPTRPTAAAALRKHRR
jgi:hypothetical protein